MLKTTLTLLTLITLSLQSLLFAQTLDSVSVKNHNKQKLSSYIVPAIFISYGAVSLAGDNFIRKLDYSTNAELKEDHPLFAVKLDNYMRYAPLAAVYGLDFAGIKAKHSIVDRSIMLVLSASVMGVGITALKKASNRERPNGANFHSFPSGHTSTAFMLAEFLHQEYKDKSVWYSVAGYSLATGTGILRMYNKAHWVSDVVAGAGFGMLSTKLAYLIYPEIKKRVVKNHLDALKISPLYGQGITGLSLSYQFKK